MNYYNNNHGGDILTYNNTGAVAALSTYKETKIKTASQGQLIIMLYDEAIKRMNRALELLELSSGERKDPGKIEEISKTVMKAEEIITELMVSLDFEQGGEISQNLFALYTWFNRELLEANIAQDKDRMTNVTNMLKELRNAWHVIISNNAAENRNREVTGINIAG